MRHLRKTLGLTAAILAMTGLMGISGAQADTVSVADNTLVQPCKESSF